VSRPAQADGADIHHCPTCGMAFLECGQAWPPSVQDVTPTRCRLPRGHRSEEHWHPPLWPGTPDLLWLDEMPHEPDLEGPR
jgi:hypothetical protein